MRQERYYRLGLFIIGGAALLVLVVVAMGAGRYFSTATIIETYLDESVNGLEVGSPVKYRGVKIGTVSKIDFVMGYYTSFDDSEYRYVLVECEVDKGGMLDRSKSEIRDAMNDDVARGLRMQPTSVGITGQLFLGIDYLDPKANPPLPISWEPNNIYIPSAPSTLSRLEKAISEVSDTISSVGTEDIEGILKGVRRALDNMNVLLESAEGQSIGQLLAANLEQTEGIFAKINTILADADAQQLLPNASRMFGTMDSILSRSGEDIVATASDMRQTFDSLKVTAAQLEEALSQPGADLSAVYRQVAATTKQAEGATTKLHELTNRLNGMVAGQEHNVQEVLEGLRLLIEDLREITAEAKRYPAGVLFGDPPAQTLPEGGGR